MRAKIASNGSTVGTIDYLAPEQARNSQAVDTRSDIYSLGCTAYHMLAGRAPFAEGGLGERLFKHLEMLPPDIRRFNLAVSGGFWGVIEKMLAKQPEDRYATPREVAKALQQSAHPNGASPRKTSAERQPGVSFAILFLIFLTVALLGLTLLLLF